MSLKLKHFSAETDDVISREVHSLEMRATILEEQNQVRCHCCSQQMSATAFAKHIFKKRADQTIISKQFWTRVKIISSSCSYPDPDQQ